MMDILTTLDKLWIITKAAAMVAAILFSVSVSIFIIQDLLDWWHGQ